ncbi:MAG: septum formation initiator family protein [Lachnospiraceae bacterium]|nr:septum formation initiator family protein [Lachnospiraceae bacterium]
MEMSRNLKKRRSTRKQSRIASMFIVMAVIFVCFVACVKVVNLHAQSRELKETEITLEKQIEDAMLEHENLLAQEQYMKTNQYIEDVAKDKLGMVYPDEIVIRPYE